MLAAPPARRRRTQSPSVTEAIGSNTATAQVRIWAYLAGMRAGQLARHEATCRLCADPEGPGYCAGAMSIATRCDEATEAANTWQATRDTPAQLEPATVTTLF